MISWEQGPETPDGHHRIFARVMDQPTVLLELIFRPDCIERRIAAVFHRGGDVKPGVLILNRGITPGSGAASEKVAKAQIGHSWNEHVRSLEPQVLRELYLLPKMSQTERAETMKRRAKKLKERQERAAELVAERKNQLAAIRREDGENRAKRKNDREKTRAAREKLEDMPPFETEEAKE